MGTDNSPNDLRGFLVPWPLDIDYIWNAQSSYTKNTPIPDVPEATGDYDLGLTSHGDFTATESIKIRTAKAGGIGTSGFVWKLESDTDYYGRDAPNIISRWDVIVEGETTARENTILDAIGLPNGDQVFLVQHEIVVPGSVTRIKAYKRTKDGTVTNVDLYSEESYKELFGGLCLLSDGSILAAYLRTEQITNTAQIQTSRSYDGGTTWSLQSTITLPSSIDISGSFGAGVAGFTVDRVRIGEALGQLLMLINVTAHNISLAEQNSVLQYSSTDNGCTFVDVGATDGTLPYFAIDIVSKDGVFHVFYIDGIDSAKFVRLENATIPLDRALGFGASVTVINGQQIAKTNPTHGYLEAGVQSVWVDEDGRFFAVYKETTNEKALFIVQSDDSDNWFFLGGNPTSSKESAAQLYNLDATGSIPTDIAGCSARGTQVLFHNVEAIGITFNLGALHYFELGGWATVNMPALKEFPESFDFGGFDITWTSYNKPDSTHFSKVGSGTITETATHTTFSSSPMSSVSADSPLFVSSSSQGVIIRTRCKPVTEGSLTQGRGLEIHTTDRKARLYISLSGLQLEDTYGTTTLGTASVTTTGGIEILFAVANNKARAWYRVSSLGAKKWLSLGGGSLASGAAAANTKVRFGHLNNLTSAAGTVETHWFEFMYAYGARTGAQLEETPANPESLVPRKYPPKGTTVYVDSGVQISTFDSPAYEGQEYTINETSMFPLYRVFTGASRTPRVGYRSAVQPSGAVPAIDLAFFWDKVVQNTAETNLGVDSLGVALVGINFREFELQRYDVGTAAWVSLGTFQNNVGGLQSFTRQGSSVVSNATNGKFLHEHECRNWTVLFVDGESSIARRVRTNSSGVLDNGTNHKRAVLQLEGVQNTDPTSGNMYLIPDSCVAVAHLLGETGAAIRIRISSQVTAESYFEIGSFVAGGLVIPQQYGRGRTVTFEGGTASEISQDGVERIRRTHPGGRTIRIAWSEGIDTSELFDITSSPDYYTATTAGGALPVGAPSATPSTMAGLTRFCNGNEVPIVYLPRISRSSNTTEIMNRRENHVLVSIQGEVSEESILGSEFTGEIQGEVFRVGSMVLRELI